MKTILLASSGKFITEEASKYLPKPLETTKLAYVTTAAKGADDTDYVDIRISRMNELNFDFEQIDVENKSKEELKELFRDKEAIYVEGGNTCYLLRAAKESGFDELVRELVDGGVTYIGSSAGSYITCPTIDMAKWKIPGKRIWHDEKLKDLSAINLVPFLLLVHYKSEWESALKDILATSNYPIRILTDEQALYVEGDSVQLLGDGEEIKI